jgi:toxin ParE1/3/4
VSELVLLYSADADIQRAYERYEEFQEGRGTVFMLHLDAALTLLRNFPEIGPVFYRNYRRLLVSGFPHGIFYAIEGQRIVVSAVMDARQDPAVIRRRLGGESD